jgi:hypothetical protein
MAISDDLFRAILAMDAYNRGYNAGIRSENAGPNEGLTGTQIGLATLSTRSNTNADSPEVAASFFAQAYTRNGKTVISYRGTETASMRRSHAGRECLVAVAVSCDRSDVEYFSCFRENLQGNRAFLGIVKIATPTLLQ